MRYLVILLILFLAACDNMPTDTPDAGDSRLSAQATLTRISNQEKQQTVMAYRTGTSLAVRATENRIANDAALREQTRTAQLATSTVEAMRYYQGATATAEVLLASRTETAQAQMASHDATAQASYATAVMEQATRTAVSLAASADATKTFVQVQAVKQTADYLWIANLLNGILGALPILMVVFTAANVAQVMLAQWQDRRQYVVFRNSTGDVVLIVRRADEGKPEVLYPPVPVQVVRPGPLQMIASDGVTPILPSNTITPPPRWVKDVEGNPFILEDDLREICEQFSRFGIAREQYLKPSAYKCKGGFVIGSPETYDKLIDLFDARHLIHGRDGSRRKSGNLVPMQIDDMMKALTST